MLPGIMPPLAGLSSHKIEVIATAGGPYNIKNFYSAADWAGPDTKRFIVPNGVFVGGYLDEGTGRGGTLELVIDGTVMGYKGHGGAGGTALFLRTTGIILSGASTGIIAGGGGAGGAGGTGGPGYYYPYEGPNYSYPTGYSVASDSGGSNWWWNSIEVASYQAEGATSVTTGGYTYYRGALQFTSLGSYYAISRQFNTATFTSGGAGGAGGDGDGANGSKTAGAAGSAGGTNAGAGGTGGTGGSVGVAGSAGTAGAAGNNGSGSAGVAGYAAGAAINGNSFITTNLFTGTYNGARV